MQMMLKHIFGLIFFAVFGLFTFGQVPSNLQELEGYIGEARRMGYTDEQIIELAREAGASENELGILQLKLESDEKIEEPEFDRTRSRQKALQARALAQEPQPGQIFGLDFFSSNSNISFESLNVPTPVDYTLGPGDELYIDIYGTSEKYYEVKINPEGTIVLTNIGPIYVNGLSIAEATKKIKTRLQKIYSGIQGSTPTTFVSVALGNVRSISVNVVGEVKAPGTYQLSGLSTAFNALYVSGGPKPTGSFRAIRVYRNSRLIAEVDLYELILEGQTDANMRLRNNDVILIPPYKSLVEVRGEVKRPGRYELIGEETLETLIGFAGGFTEKAYTAKIKVTRNSDKERMVSDVFNEQYAIFQTSGGDVYRVDRILDRFSNRVLIKGAVFRPGNYAISDGLSVKQLVERADGLRGDAFLKRAIITRSKPDYSTETITLNLRAILSGDAPDVLLQREDVLEVLSIYDFKEERFVRISGEVNVPGVFRFSESMTVEDLIFLAKGLTKAAQEGTIEVSRRPETQSWENQTEVLRMGVDRDLNVSQSEFKLEPFDHVIVRRNPTYFEEKVVEVVGHVNFPGQYSLQRETERISDLINRSGGLTKYGYAKGATLIRKTEFFESQRQLEERRKNLLSVVEGIDSVIYSESDQFVTEKILEELDRTYQVDDMDNSNLAAAAKKERLEELARRSVYLSDVKFNESESIALDLEKILSNPGSDEDLVLEDGDIINVPKKLAMVRMRGKVLYPNTVRFEEEKSAKYYINKAGGFESRAKKGRTYVVYANGDVSRTKRFLFFKIYPNAAPGSEIIVPGKPPKMPVRATDAIAITTGLATIAALIIPLTTK